MNLLRLIQTFWNVRRLSNKLRWKTKLPSLSRIPACDWRQPHWFPILICDSWFPTGTLYPKCWRFWNVGHLTHTRLLFKMTNIPKRPAFSMCEWAINHTRVNRHELNIINSHWTYLCFWMWNALSAQGNSNVQSVNVRWFYPVTTFWYRCQFMSRSYIYSHPKQNQCTTIDDLKCHSSSHIQQETHGQKAKSHGFYGQSRSMNRENQPLVTDELVEFEKWPVEVHDFRKFTDHFRGIYGPYLKSMKKEQNDVKHITGWAWIH